MSDWKPIETAPKDGTRILVLGSGCGDKNQLFQTVAIWKEADFRGGAQWWPVIAGWPVYSDSAFETEETPTHWMPLPSPPEEK